MIRFYHLGFQRFAALLWLGALSVLLLAHPVAITALGHGESSVADAPRELTPITITALRGPTGVGIAHALLNQPVEGTVARVHVDVVPEPSVMVGRLVNGETDIGMLPSNVAAQLHARGVPVQIAAVSLWGVLYLVGTDSAIAEWDDLSGRTIHSIAQGANPDQMLRHLMAENGVDPDTEATLEYGYGHVELAQLVAAGEIELAVLPEPFVTSVLGRNPDLRVLLDFQTEWERLYGESYPQTAIVVRSDVAERVPAAIDEALAVIASGWERALENPLETAGVVEQTDLGLSAAVVQEALPRFNARYVPAREAAAALTRYFTILAQSDPRSVGGAVPGPDLYR